MAEARLSKVWNNLLLSTDLDFVVTVFLALLEDICTVETHIKEPFIITLRLTFNILNPLNNDFSGADIGGGSYLTGFMS